MIDNHLELENRVNEYYKKLLSDAKSADYFINPDESFTLDLIQGLLTNQDRYDYPSCPCRLSAGKKEEDLDIICPCDYRDADINKYGACYCALYVSKEIVEGKRTVKPVPERRIPSHKRKSDKKEIGNLSFSNLKYPVWRCRVCGYLCARDKPPDICTICKVSRDRFERFI